MSSLATLGTILTTGFVAGELAEFLRLPKVTGYILCGVLLNPDLSGIVSRDFVAHTEVVTHLALAFITFSVGGTLLAGRIRSLGKAIVWITLFEAEGALLLVFAAFAFVLTLWGGELDSSLAGAAVAASLLVAAVASPTDPTATLAVVHQYEAKGPVSSTLMGVAAFDDVFGIVNFSLAVAFSRMLVTHRAFDPSQSLLLPLAGIVFGIAVGSAFGWVLNLTVRLVKRETEGALIVLILGLLGLCYGAAESLAADPLLATMSMGAMVVNFSPVQEKIFAILERYTEELVFVLFFTISGMSLDLDHLTGMIGLIALFVVARAAGKLLGATAGAFIGRAPPAVRRYAFLGLLPQGGIVIGLTLSLQYQPGLKPLAGAVLTIVVGATVIHEVLGPVASKIAIRRSGEAGA